MRSPMVVAYLASQNKIKIEEAREIIPGIEPLDIELTEIQSPDPAVVVRHKLHQVAAAGLTKPVLVEDTGLFVHHWRTLPGALIKWFVEELGTDRLYQALTAEGPTAATAVSAVGIVYRDETGVWQGQTTGRIVRPRGDLGGWTPVFEVGDTGMTLGEMSFPERMHHTMRAAPLRQAVAWLAERQPDRNPS
ncbi:non-canonical purine NTP pyrophosphatase [Micromonospora sp. NPDC049101]|uniref:non-canonical purine NTP pyrophosphatase n=1 Tax=unclassified Micromonospora TaxID=2617518 RepID=UPI0033DF4B95